MYNYIQEFTHDMTIGVDNDLVSRGLKPTYNTDNTTYKSCGRQGKEGKAEFNRPLGKSCW